jgi:hypothetical protein
VYPLMGLSLLGSNLEREKRLVIGLFDTWFVPAVLSSMNWCKTIY